MAYTTGQSVQMLDTNFRAARSGRAADGVL